MKVLQTTGDDLKQIDWMNQFISSYCDVIYYYQQNQVLLKSLKVYMDEIIKKHDNIKNIKDNAGNSIETRIQIESCFRRIYELLQRIQNDCICYKV